MIRQAFMKKYGSFLKHAGKIASNLAEVKQVYGWTGIKRQIYKILYKPKCKDNYQHWINRYDTLTAATKRKMIRQLRLFSRKPCISILLPLYNLENNSLAKTIASIQSQFYSHWQLFIVDMTISDLTIDLTGNRIKIISRKNHDSFAQTMNSVLKLITSEYVAIIDQSGNLSEHALFWIVNTINKNHNIKLIYSDEDQLDHNNDRSNPYFKCDWNLDLFLSQNLIGNLGVYQTDLIREIGGFRDGFTGNYNYEMVLRYIEKITTDQIFHIPRVLFHNLTPSQSSQLLTEKKEVSKLAGEKAINDYLKRNNICANAQALEHTYRINYKIQSPYPLVSLIIPTRNGYDVLRACITSIIEKTTYPNYQIIIIDNGSNQQQTLSYLELLNQDHRIQVQRDNGPFNHSALNNRAAQTAQGSIIGLVNNDVEVISIDWLEEMVSHAIRPEVGAVGARLWHSDHTLQHGGMILGINWGTGHSHKGYKNGDTGYFGRTISTQSFSALTGACLFVRKTLFEKVGGLDEDLFPTDYNDVDLCLNLGSLGYRNIWTPYAQLYHHESATRGPHNTKEKRQRFIKASTNFSKKWEDIVFQDPAYNPNLTLDDESFSLAWPPRLKIL